MSIPTPEQIKRHLEFLTELKAAVESELEFNVEWSEDGDTWHDHHDSEFHIGTRFRIANKPREIWVNVYDCGAYGEPCRSKLDANREADAKAQAYRRVECVRFMEATNG